MKKLFVMCGIPASGKSTTARAIAKEEGAVIISSDTIRNQLFPGQKYCSYQNEETFQTMRARVTEAYNNEQSMIIDAVNNMPSERKQFVARAHRKGYKAICVFCDKHYEHALYANKLRRKKGIKAIPDSVIIASYQRLNPPSMDEGWDEIRFIDGNYYSVVVEGQLPLE